MKNQFIITVAVLAITSITSQIIGQELSKVKVQTGVEAVDDWETPVAKSGANGQHIKQGILVCRVTPADGGCSLNFTKIKTEYSDARKKGSGQLDFFVSSTDNSLTQVASPRDASSGLATGRRQSRPTSVGGAVAREASAPPISEISVSKTQDESVSSRTARAPSVSEISSSSVAGTGMGAGKANFQDLHFVVKSSGKTISKGTCPDGTCNVSTDLPDGEYTMVCSWSWGESNSGAMASGSGMSSGKSTPKLCSVDFLLQIENGDCMAINQKGLPGEKKPNNTTTNNPK